MCTTEPSASIKAKRTPLFECHQEAGARFTEFFGWEMPVQYSGLVDEHHTVRNQVGIFDVSHMGEITFKGPEALESLQYLTSNNVAKLFPGKAQYSLLTNPKGGVVDDIIVYMLAENDYLVCVNAANANKDFKWMTEQNKHNVEINDVSSDYAQIAVQGPKAETLMTNLLEVDDTRLNSEGCPFFTVHQIKPASGMLSGINMLLARTGYTGEDGFEIFSSTTDAPTIWRALTEVGKNYGLKPAGLGARDTLRLEACLPLHGHELGDDITALESSLGWVVKLKKGEFLGRDVLAKQKEEGLTKKLIGFEVLDRGIVRDGAEIFTPEGQKIGIATSGTKTPTLDKALGLGFVGIEHSAEGTELEAVVRGRNLKIKIIKTPFYKRS